jgi:hypothetical protein
MSAALAIPPPPPPDVTPTTALHPAAHTARRPALPALTGLRTILALTILLFHFTPNGLTWASHPRFTLYPLIDIGYVFVSFFFLISGFILSYNYAGRPQPVNAADFWMARLSRLYPVYALTMAISIPMLMAEWVARSRTQFVEGVITTPLLLQGFFPRIATFWNTVSWTLSCEVVLYLLFPYLLRLRWPRGTGKLLAMVVALWLVGLIPHTIYLFTNPDHLAHTADRYSDGYWLDTLKFTPLPYLCTFLAGLTLGRLHESAAHRPHAHGARPRRIRRRLVRLLPPHRQAALHPGPRRPAHAALRGHHHGTRRAQPAGQLLFMASAGRRRRVHLLPLPAALQRLPAAAQQPRPRAPARRPLRPLDQLRLHHPAGARRPPLGGAPLPAGHRRLVEAPPRRPAG